MTIPNTVEPKRVFVSYSHKDEAMVNRLLDHLIGLEIDGLIQVWHDRAIDAGEEWRKLIEENLNKSNIILLMVSSHFLASDFCRNVEMEQALARHEERRAIVIPVILRKVNWKTERFGKLNALPRDGKPITKWGDRDEAFAYISTAIRGLVTNPNPSKTRSALVMA